MLLTASRAGNLPEAEPLHPKAVLAYMRQQREQFLRFVDDSVGAAYVPPFDSFPTLLVEARSSQAKHLRLHFSVLVTGN
jgi:hypothetical protein